MTAMSPIKNKVTMEQLMHNYRIKMVVTTLEVVKDYPMIGIGFGNETYGEKIDLHMYNNRAPKKYQQSDHLIIKAPHNMLLNILVRTGIVGLVLFLSILSVFAGMCWRCARNGADDFVRKWGLCIGSALLAFLVIGMFEQMFHHVAEMLLYTILAMGTIVWRIRMDTVWTINTDPQKESHRC
jgi:O-antigen ligase